MDVTWLRMHLARSAMVSILVAALLAGGCSSGSGETSRSSSSTSQSSSTAPSTSSTSTTVARTEAAVLAAYRAFWAAYVAAGDPMDPRSAGLVATAVNPALETVQRSFLAHLTGGEVIRGTLDLHPRVTALAGTAATVTDCYQDHTHVFNAQTGAQVDPPEEHTFAVTATLAQADGAWKVSLITKDGQGCTPS